MTIKSSDEAEDQEMLKRAIAMSLEEDKEEEDEEDEEDMLRRAIAMSLKES